MRILTEKINLDLNQNGIQATIDLREGDIESRLIIATLRGYGDAFRPDDNVIAVIRAKKPDGTIIYNNCLVEDGKVKFLVSSQYAAVVGNYNACIELIKDGVVLYSPKFSFHVAANELSDSEVESASEYTELTAALEQALAALELAQNLHLLKFVENLEDEGDEKYLYVLTSDYHYIPYVWDAENERYMELESNLEELVEFAYNLNLQKERIDNLLEEAVPGSTTRDLEVIDGRNGYDGRTYANLGTAIREQVNDLHSENTNLQNSMEAADDNLDNIKANKSDVNTTTANIEAEIAVERARIDNIASLAEGSTTGDAELLDIRVGEDGLTYNSAGDAVRNQNKKLRNALTNYSITINENDGSGTKKYYFDIQKGSICSFKNNSTDTCSLNILLTPSTIQRIKALVGVGETVDFICPENAIGLQCYCNSSDQKFLFTSDNTTIYTDKIQNNAVTESKINNNAITESKLSEELDVNIFGKRTVFNDITAFPTSKGIVDYDNTWYQYNNSNYKHATIATTGDINIIKVKAPITHNTYLMAVTENSTASSGTIANISTYWIRRVEIPAGVTFSAILPTDTKYVFLNTLYNNINCVEEFELKCVNVNKNYSDETMNKRLNHIVASAQNVRDFSDGSGDGCPDNLVSTNLPLWKNFVSKWLNSDFLAITEWYNYFDRSQTINAYNEIFKQFYPYKYATPRNNTVRIILSKHPCVCTDLKDICLCNLSMPMLHTVIDGKTVAVVCWLQSNQDTPATRIQAYENTIRALGYFDKVIIMGDFNTESGLDELQTFTDAGYTLGNGGYWGVINTWEDVTPNDNIITKGFNYELFEKGEKITSDHSAVRAKLSF